MPPSSLSDEIEELFAEASGLGREWYPHDSYRITSGGIQRPPPKARAQIGAEWRRRDEARVRTHRPPPYVIKPVEVVVQVCRVCGGRLELREGNPQPIHMGGTGRGCPGPPTR